MRFASPLWLIPHCPDSELKITVQVVLSGIVQKFFCKGALETVKKFGWPPDVVHCHGWMTSLIPFYLKTSYKNDPVFKHSKVVFSVYDQKIESSFNEEFLTKAAINNLKPEQLLAFKNGTGITLDKGAIQYADGIIQGSSDISDVISASIKSSEKPFIQTKAEEFLPSYIDFHKNLIH